MSTVQQTVKQAIARALERSKAARTADGKIKGRKSGSADRAAYQKAVSGKPAPTGKPRSWKPVCPTPGAVKVGVYERWGTKDGILHLNTVNPHCRNPPR